MSNLVILSSLLLTDYLVSWIKDCYYHNFNLKNLENNNINFIKMKKTKKGSRGQLEPVYISTQRYWNLIKPRDSLKKVYLKP